MPNMKSLREVIAYFEEKSRQGEHKQDGAYFEAVNDVLLILESDDDLAEMKSQVRQLHRDTLRIIQQTEEVEKRIEQRKQLAVYDDCLTRLRTVQS